MYYKLTERTGNACTLEHVADYLPQVEADAAVPLIIHSSFQKEFELTKMLYADLPVSCESSTFRVVFTEGGPQHGRKEKI